MKTIILDVVRMVDGKKRKQRKEFNIEPSFVPQDVNDICSLFMDNYIETKDNETKIWYAKLNQPTSATRVKKDRVTGEEKEEVYDKFPGLQKVRYAFARKFFPDLVPDKKKKPNPVQESWEKFKKYIEK